MEYGAIDLHKKESQVRILTAGGAIVDRRIPTQREAFTTLFGGRTRMRILLEASTESEWVARHLETMGHEVVIGDPNYAPMYGTRTRRIKTDRRDVVALTEACRHGVYRAVYRRSPRAWTKYRDLQVRDYIVRTRGAAISVVRALTRAEGCRIRSGATETFLTRLAALELPAALQDRLPPVERLIAACNAELITCEGRLALEAERDPVIRRLMTMPSIGAITATAFVAALDDVTRFRRAAQVTSYLGLVPREYSSGERQRRGRLLRSAHPRVQALLVQAAWRICRSRRPETAVLRLWAEGVAQRRGAKIAVVALARRVARILFAMWRDETDYTPAPQRDVPPRVTTGDVIERTV
jgi:transposase